MANIIQASLLKYKEIRGTNLNLIGSNGSDLKVIGKINKKILVEGQSIVVEFFVCKKLEAKCILGIPFSKQNNVILKFGGENCDVTLQSEQKKSAWTA